MSALWLRGTPGRTRMSALLHALAEQGDAIIRALHDGFEPLQLQGLQLRQRQEIRRAERMETSV